MAVADMAAKMRKFDKLPAAGNPLIHVVEKWHKLKEIEPSILFHGIEDNQYVVSRYVSRKG